MIQPALPPDDPRRVRPGESRQRDHLANERTLLAWLRLAVGLFAFGFVIARFGLFLVELGLASPLHTRLAVSHSLVLGLGFVAAGVLLTALALSHYLTIERDIEQGIVQAHHRLVYAVVAICVLSGILLFAYLAIGWPTP